MNFGRAGLRLQLRQERSIPKIDTRARHYTIGPRPRTTVALCPSDGGAPLNTNTQVCMYKPVTHHGPVQVGGVVHTARHCEVCERNTTVRGMIIRVPLMRSNWLSTNAHVVHICPIHLPVMVSPPLTTARCGSRLYTCGRGPHALPYPAIRVYRACT